MRPMVHGAIDGRSYLLVGGPRLGKSILLKLVAQHIKDRTLTGSKTRSLRCLLFDMKSIVSGGTQQFLRMLWNKLDSMIQGSVGNSQEAKLRDRMPKQPWVWFTEKCEDRWKNLQGSVAWCSYVLFLDNADVFLSKGFEKCMEHLVSWKKSGQAGTPHAIVMTSGRSLRDASKRNAAMQSLFAHRFLSVFTPDEASRILEQVYPHSGESWRQEVCSLTGRHPHLLNLVLSACLEHEKRDLQDSSNSDNSQDPQAPHVPSEPGDLDEPNEPMDPDNTPLETILPHVLVAADPWCEAIWDAFSAGRKRTLCRGPYAAPEHLAMRYLIENKDGTSIKAVEKELKRRRLKEAFSFLEYVGVAEKALYKDTSCYLAHCELWNDWYQKRVMQ